MKLSYFLAFALTGADGDSRDNLKNAVRTTVENIALWSVGQDLTEDKQTTIRYIFEVFIGIFYSRKLMILTKRELNCFLVFAWMTSRAASTERSDSIVKTRV